MKFQLPLIVVACLTIVFNINMSHAKVAQRLNVITIDNASRLQQIQKLQGGRRVLFNQATGLLLTNERSEVQIWDVQDVKAPNLKQVIDLNLDEQEIVMNWALSSNGQVLAVANENLDTYEGRLRLIDVPSGKEITTLWQNNIEISIGRIFQVEALAFSPDETLLAQNSLSGIRLWDVNTYNELELISLVSEGGIRSLAFSPDGSMIAAGVGDNLYDDSKSSEIRLSDVKTGEELAVLEGHTDDVVELQFSPSGDMLVSTSSDRTVRVWDMQTFEQIRMTQSDFGGQLLAFSPDGRLLALSGPMATIHLWDMQTGQEIVVLYNETEEFNNWVLSLAFSPNGRLLVASYSDQSVRLWGIPSDTPPSPCTATFPLVPCGLLPS